MNPEKQQAAYGAGSEQKNPVVEIRRTVRDAFARVPFKRIAREILLPSYQLSLVICGDALAERINRTYRKKNYPTNVLSFSLDKHEGEIFLNADAAAREARRYRVTLRERLTLLFIHGCLHLKGLRHGTYMEKLEKKTLKKFG